MKSLGLAGTRPCNVLAEARSTSETGITTISNFISTFATLASPAESLKGFIRERKSSKNVCFTEEVHSFPLNGDTLVVKTLGLEANLRDRVRRSLTWALQFVSDFKRLARDAECASVYT